MGRLEYCIGDYNESGYLAPMDHSYLYFIVPLLNYSVGGSNPSSLIIGPNKWEGPFPLLMGFGYKNVERELHALLSNMLGLLLFVLTALFIMVGTESLRSRLNKEKISDSL
ncbi:hypothetical protein Syun_021107 [Stephania yunnanensis]|uniref:Uncharacterized protein n=1 Tax=Stephania yunnanensis TaxID=152371 RepID=A0AAP0NQR0_9MAGN